MTGRPYVVLQLRDVRWTAASTGQGEDRLVLSGEADLDRVGRRACRGRDAILVRRPGTIPP